MNPVVIKLDSAQENKQYIEEYIQYLKADRGCTKCTIKAYHHDLQQFCRFYPTKNFLKDIDNRAIRKYKYFLVDQEYKPRSVNRKISVIRNFYQYFIHADEYQIYKSPVKNITRMKEPYEIPITLSEQEAESMLDAILFLGSYAMRDYAMFLTFLFTALRVSELINLKVNDVNLHEGILIVKQGKGRKDRVIPLAQRACRALDYYINTEIVYKPIELNLKTKRKTLYRIDKSLCGRKYFVVDPKLDSLFLTQGGTSYSVKGVEYLFHKYTKAVGVYRKGLSLHALRRSCLTFLYNQGVDIFVLREISGHSNVQTLKHYLNVSSEKLKEAVNCHPLSNQGVDMKLVRKIREGEKR